MTYTDQLADLSAADSALGVAITPLRNLEAILKWAPGAGIAFTGVDLVQQDEYSYDLYLPLPDSRWLVFGVS